MAERGVSAVGAGAAGAPAVQLASYVVGRLIGLWPQKVGRMFGEDGRLQGVFTQSLAAELAARRIDQRLVDEGLRRLVGEGREWPPLEVPVLVRYFSPVRDYAAALAEAVGHAVAMTYGERVVPSAWSHPAVYWAAERMGWFELRNTESERLMKRWPLVLDEVLAWAEWPPIHAPALPRPGGVQTRAAAGAAMARARELLASGAARRDEIQQQRLAENEAAVADTLRRSW